LRVGFVSRDLKFGAVGFFLEGLLRALDRSRFELFAYSLSGDEDSTTQRLRQSVPNWREALTLSAADLDAQIVADRIDILVDLIGHTGSGPSPAFALKPAPVTVTWLAYSGTTGLSTMDYILADSVVIPPSEEGLFTEKVWRLPDSYLCYSPPLDTPPVAPLPALSRGCISFGSFNNLNKISDRTLALWARVLEAVPGSELVLKGIGMRQGQLEAAFAAYGIAPSRLRLLSMELATTDHLGLYREIDIGLDPFPYNGTTTTCEAMLMGVPVLAIKGDRFIAHVGESLLRTAGLPEWVAADEADYVRKAVDFAADRSRLSALRQQLRQQLFASPLCDATSFARNFEAALRGMWQRWCLEQSTPARTD
jgi:predicted O-linked N-acetylglucosamine transferase (SPINDLY family)